MKAYPLKSENGSSIILYGHENGVRVIWRGGRPFKDVSQTSTASQKSNGAEGTIISLESDDDEPASKTFQDKPEFEEEEELDGTKPYPEILQTLDLHFGSDVLHLAVLPTPLLQADGSSSKSLQKFKQKVVFTAACADNTVRLVTLPLTPPSPASKSRPEFRSDFTKAFAGQGSWGETITTLFGQQKPSRAVSMTIDFPAPPDPSKLDSKSSKSEDAQFIIASYSAEAMGLLLLFRISTKSPSDSQPFQKVYLASPAKSIAFNPSLAVQRSSHLLVADTKGACRIYDYKKLAKVSEEGSEFPAAEQGTWLLSLFTGFHSSKNDAAPLAGVHNGYGRKSLVDAQWVAGGQAIIVLLQDGEWAIWDIEGVGPGASQGLLGRAGVKAGSMSEYNLTGYLDIGVKARHPAPAQNSGSKFAPMTPSTRKSVEPFGGRGSSGQLQGQISVSQISTSSSSTPLDESIVFRLDEAYMHIPSLAKYWAANSRRGGSKGSNNPFTSAAPGSRMTKVDGVDLQGERCSGIEQIANVDSSDLLILGEHRFTIVLTGKQPKVIKARVPAGRSALIERDGNVAGDLDVMEIDQALTRMENGQSKRGKIFQV